MKPLHEFSIQADKGTHLKVAVKVWRYFGQLQEERTRLRTLHKQKYDFQLCDGFTWVKNKRHCDDLVVAEIHLCKSKLTVDTIAHECVHAAVVLVAWFRPCSRAGDEQRHEANERDLCITEHVIDEGLAYPVGHLTEGIIWNLRKQKFKIKPL